jgi:hypothetical protein
MPRRSVSVLFLALLFATPLFAQPVKVGPEFQINSTTFYTRFPRVALGPHGDFVVVWNSFDGDSKGDPARRFGPQGAPLGLEFQPHSDTAGRQHSASLAMDPRGGFVVTWSGDRPGGEGVGAFARRFDSSGAPSAPEFQVSLLTNSYEGMSRIAMDASGGFVIAWLDYSSTWPANSIWGRRFDGLDVPAGPPFQVDSSAPGVSGYPSLRPRLSMRASGEFIVVWQNPDGYHGGVAARLFDASGVPVAPGFQINTDTIEGQVSPDVVMDNDGMATVVWGSYSPSVTQYLRGQRLDDLGTLVGPEFGVEESDPFFSNVGPSIASGENGAFNVVWETTGEDFHGIALRPFDSSGSPVSGELQVGSNTTTGQYMPAIGGDGAGNFVVVWMSYDSTENEGVFGQRYCASPDVDGDEVCTGPDTCPTVANPSQTDTDQDGRGDACDLILTAPLEGESLDCSKPHPEVAAVIWNAGPYDRYRAYIGWDPSFAPKTFVDSGDRLLTGTSWTPARQEWKRACQRATRNGSSQLYLRVYGVDRDAPPSDPLRTKFSPVVTVGVQR